MSPDQEVALYCLFHNASSYETADSLPCSHIFAGVIRKEERGLSLGVYDYDGQARRIETAADELKFDLAIMVPVSENHVDRLGQCVEQINRLSELDRWPFYFSRDMSIRPEREVRNKYAIAPEGHVDPPIQEQKLDTHQAVGQRLLARINCVRMSLLTARFSGIKIDNVAGIDPLSNTGEEIRDTIKAEYRRLSRQQGTVLTDKFTKKAKSSDDKDPDFVLGDDGLCIVQSNRKEFRIKNVEDALARRIRGKSLFDWITDGEPEKFSAEPLPPPLYLKTALDFCA